MSSLRTLLLCCIVGFWLSACGAPADAETTVAQLVSATYGARYAITLAYLAPVTTDPPTFVARRLWRAADGNLTELPLETASRPDVAPARYTFRIVTQTPQRMTVEVDDNYEGGGGATER